MYQHLARRVIAGLAVVAATTLGSAMPAQAAAEQRVGLRLDPAYNVGVDDAITILPHLSATQAVTLTGATITYELSGDLAGVSLVNPANGSCTSVSPTRLTCTAASEIALGPASRSEHLNAGLTTTAAAVMGATGTLKTTFSADGVDADVDTAPVRVVDRIDMAVPEPQVTVSVKPGDTFTSRLRLTNVGKSVIKGAGILFNTPYAIEPAQRFSNCIYGSGVVRGCRFAQDLRPGVTYEMTLPSRLRKDTFAPGAVAVDGLWTDDADYADWAAELLGGTANKLGTGGPLVFEPVADERRAAGQYDRTADDNRQHITVKVLGEQGADVAAVGAKVSGAAGAVVEAEVGVRNLGPATLDLFGPYTRSSVAVVTIPAGAEVVTVPDLCKPADDAVRTDEDAVRYSCETFEILHAEETISWTFGLRITTVVPNATGSVEANPACDGNARCGSFTKDLNPSNDTAALIINPTDAQPGDGDAGAGADGGTSGGADGGTDGGTSGGTGGGLPITGPQGAAYGVAGALLVMAGAFFVVSARRRRIRFES